MVLLESMLGEQPLYALAGGKGTGVACLEAVALYSPRAVPQKCINPGTVMLSLDILPPLMGFTASALHRSSNSISMAQSINCCAAGDAHHGRAEDAASQWKH